MKKSIAVFDIDGTIREIVDPWMMLHNHFDTGAEGSSIYKNWLENTISYHEMCEQDAQLWSGKSKEEMIKPLMANPIRDGIQALIHYLKKNNYLCIGISTGLSLFNDITAQLVGLDFVISNEIVFQNEVCTGKVIVHVEEFKKDIILKEVIEKYAIDGKVISFGDGKSDIDLFDHSDISFATHSKYEEVNQAATHIWKGKSFEELIPMLQK